MCRSFTHYWKNSTWVQHQESADGDTLEHTAGNMFIKRGVRVGDRIYVVTVLSGKLYLCGKMAVAKICDSYEACPLCAVATVWSTGWRAS
jgi:tRNA(Arg) A34 adenosine deaminase TadA